MVLLENILLYTTNTETKFSATKNLFQHLNNVSLNCYIIKKKTIKTLLSQIFFCDNIRLNKFLFTLMCLPLVGSTKEDYAKLVQKFKTLKPA